MNVANTPTTRVARCSEGLEDWEGNLMVDRQGWGDGYVYYLRVWYKTCTMEADESLGICNVLHAIWELRWLKEDFGTVLDGFLRGQTIGTKQWSYEAMEGFRRLNNMVLK